MDGGSDDDFFKKSDRNSVSDISCFEPRAVSRKSYYVSCLILPVRTVYVLYSALYLLGLCFLSHDMTVGGLLRERLVN